MKKIVLLVCLFLFSCLKFSYSQPIVVKIEIDTENPKEGENDKWLFGGFIEFIRDYVNGPSGIWSQELADRGMDINHCGAEISCDWEKYTTDITKSEWELMEGGYNKNGTHFQRLTSLENGVETGIKQKVQVQRFKSYSSYFYAKSPDNEISFSFKIMNINGQTLQAYAFDEQNIKDWTKLEPGLIDNTYETELYFVISIVGKGTLYIDEASVMPSDNVDGIRKEAYDMFKEWKMGLLRYPGGWFADRYQSNFHFGIGPIDQRKSPNLMSDGFNQRMDFGTVEYMKLCRNLDIDPYIVVNLETGTPELAAQWVEYCNGSVDTEYGARRAANGHPEPYKVRVWEIGNEQWNNPAKMAQDYLLHFDAMKKVDPSIFTIVDGYQYGGQEYFNACMNVIQDKTDLYGYHPSYVGYPKDDPEASDIDRYYHYVCSPDDMSWHINVTKEYINELGYPHIKQGSTEWWTEYGQYGEDDWLIDTNYRNSSLESALNTATVLIESLSYPYTFIMNVKTIGIGTLRRQVKSDGEKILYGTSNYQAVQMFSNHYGRKTLPTYVESPVYDVANIEGWWKHENMPYVRAIATANSDTVFLAVINRHLDKEAHIFLNWNFQPSSSECKIYTLTSDHFLDNNAPDHPLKIIPVESNWNFSNEITVPTKSVSIIAVPANIPASVSPDAKDWGFNIYPNPANDEVNLFFAEDTNVGIAKIFDISGRMVLEKAFYASGPKTIDLSSLVPGVYFIELEQGNKRMGDILVILR